MAIEELPADQFNVVVEDDMDKARLLWLVNHIGDTKLRKSVAKYQSRWPDSKPFVSTLLKWYHLSVPVSVYAPVRVPVYWLYLLYAIDRTEVKVGMTGDWPVRVFALIPRDRNVCETYDCRLSQAFLVGGRKVGALRRETAIKKAFAHRRSRPADAGNNGYAEWFDARIFGDILQMPSSFDEETHRYVQTLGDALALHRFQSLTQHEHLH